MKATSYLKSFWRLYIPTVGIVVTLLLCAIIITSFLIRDVYLSTLKQQLNNASAFIMRRFDDSLRVMKEQVAIIEREADLSVAALYAFDDSIDDQSFLKNELGKIAQAIDMDVIIVKSVTSDKLVYTGSIEDNTVGDFMSTFSNEVLDDSGGLRLIRNKYFLIAKGEIVNLGENIGEVFMIKEIDAKYLNDIGVTLGAVVVILDKSNNVVVRSAPFDVPKDLNCKSELSSLIAGDVTYYYGCSTIPDVFGMLTIAHFYNGSILFQAIGRTNTYLLAIGSLLITVSVILTLLFCRSYLLQLRKLTQLMQVDEGDSLFKSFDKLEERTLLYKKMLADKSKLEAIGQSTAMVAHDVRRPLASMKAMLKSIPAIKDDPAKIDNMIVDVDRSIAQTNAMLDDILSFSRDSTALDLKEHDPQGIITSALGDALRNHPGATVKIGYDLRHTHTLHVDSNRISRVLTNIIDNALDAMTPAGSDNKATGSLCITTYETERDSKKMLGITIADEGPGIPENTIEKIFDPFFTHGKKGGTGLGLAISHRVISLHGGRIEARNRKQEAGNMNQKDHVSCLMPHASGCSGAEFVIELPAGGCAAVINESELIFDSAELKPFREEEKLRTDYGDTANTLEFMRINKGRGRKSRLIMVDDEPLFRESVRSLLSQLEQVRDHVEMTDADSAENALKLFETQQFDYVIADIDLGKMRMNGYEFAMLVLEKYPNAYVVIHSNKRKEELDIQIREYASKSLDLSTHAPKHLGTFLFMGFLPKPMHASELLQFLACKTFEAQAPRCPGAQGPRCILLVNDDECVRIGLKFQLEAAGDVQVLEADGVSDALSKLAANDIDIILSDINLGDDKPTGYDLLKQVRTGDKQAPAFYMISGYSKADEGQKATALGATGYLQLPVEDKHLSEILTSNFN